MDAGKFSNKPKMKKKILIIAGLVLSLANAIPSVQAGFSMVPSNDHDRRQFNFELKPGETKQDSVVIENNNDAPLALFLYGADATHSNQGSFALVNRSAPQRTVGNWIKFEEPSVTLQAGEKKEIPFTVVMPDNVTPGNYAGGIAAETTTVQQTAGEKKNNAGAGVVISSRLVVKLFISVPGEKTLKYEWTDFSHIMTPNGKHRCVLSFSNEGNEAITIEPEIEITSLGRPPEKLKVPGITLLQNEKITIPFDWDKEPFFGVFNVKGTTTVWEYDIANNQNINPKILTKNISFWVIPWDIAAVVLGILAILAIWGLSRFLIMKKLKKSSKPYQVQENETLVSIAQNAGVNWKKLAKLNKLKPPFAIKKGDVLNVPSKK